PPRPPSPPRTRPALRRAGRAGDAALARGRGPQLRLSAVLALNGAGPRHATAGPKARADFRAFLQARLTLARLLQILCVFFARSKRLPSPSCVSDGRGPCPDKLVPAQRNGSYHRHVRIPGNRLHHRRTRSEPRLG